MAVGATNPLVSALISNMRKSVNEFIGKVNEYPDIKAASYVTSGIDHAASTYDYAGSLELTIDKVDKTVATQLDDLENIVDTLIFRDPAEMPNLKNRVLEFIKSLQLAKWQPQLTEIEPARMIIDKNGRYKVSFSGRFKDAGSHGSNFDSNGLISTSHWKWTSNQITFAGEIPLGKLPKTALVDRFFIKGRLEVNYQAGYIQNITKSATFHVNIEVFPLKIGKITAIFTKKVAVKPPEYRRFIFPKLYLDRADYPPDALIERTVTICSSEGWLIKKGSPMISSNTGLEYIPEDRYNDDQVELTLTLRPGQEKREVQVEFDEFFQEFEEREFPEPIELRWGEERIVKKLPEESVRIEFESYVDGKKRVFTEPDDKQPYLKVYKLGAHIRLVAVAPEER